MSRGDLSRLIGQWARAMAGTFDLTGEIRRVKR
jgi:hypothetical protein